MRSILFKSRITNFNELCRFYYAICNKKNITIATNEIFPSNYVVTLGENKDKKVVPGITRWGFESYKKGQLLINARAESVEEKKTFSKPFKETRCVFPRSGFYEWTQDKEKILFTQKEEVMYVPGFYRVHKTGAGFESESIIMTTAANSSVSPFHDRMPLVLAKQDVQKWISNLDFARSYLTAKMPDLSQIEAAK